MPKMIKDLEEKILETAQHLFTSESYADVDMRRIATETGIAAGTLYNDCPSKQDLLLPVVEHRAGFTVGADVAIRTKRSISQEYDLSDLPPTGCHGLRADLSGDNCQTFHKI